MSVKFGVPTKQREHGAKMQLEAVKPTSRAQLIAAINDRTVIVRRKLGKVKAMAKSMFNGKYTVHAKAPEK